MLTCKYSSRALKGVIRHSVEDGRSVSDCELALFVVGDVKRFFFMAYDMKPPDQTWAMPRGVFVFERILGRQALMHY